MAADEQIHEEVVRGLATRGRNRLAGTFRAAVFGANDGLVSNLSLVMGMAASGVASSVVLLSGIAGLLAGALSMGAGEFVSVRSQRELLAATRPTQITLAAAPKLDIEHNELLLVYLARGMSHEAAEHRVAERMGLLSCDCDPSLSLQPELPDAEDQHEAVGTAWGASLSSFCFFASGAIVPILPFLFGMTGVAALVVAGVLVGLALLMTGGVVGLLSGTSPLTRGPAPAGHRAGRRGRDVRAGPGLRHRGGLVDGLPPGRPPRQRAALMRGRSAAGTSCWGSPPAPRPWWSAACSTAVRALGNCSISARPRSRPARRKPGRRPACRRGPAGGAAARARGGGRAAGDAGAAPVRAAIPTGSWPPTTTARPVGYSPCRPLHYVVNADLVPAGAQDLIPEAIDTMSRATGIRFIYDGATAEQPSAQRASLPAGCLRRPLGAAAGLLDHSRRWRRSSKAK